MSSSRTTSRRIVKLLKDAGAAEVHVAIASPALKYPCFYGIDIQDRDELIAATHTTDEIREAIGADSLTYCNNHLLTSLAFISYPNILKGVI